MLVEINLLPQKDPKKVTLLVILAGLLVILLATGTYYFLQINSTKSDIANVDRQISMTKKIRETEEAKSQTVESSNSVSQLKTAIDWAATYPIQTIPVMRHLTSLLPERGFIQSFGYTEVGAIALTVQFDNPREAAYFLDSLHQSKWIEDATLSSLTASAQEDPNKTGQAAQTTQSDTAATTGTTGQNTADTAGQTAPTADSQAQNPAAAAGATANASATAAGATTAEKTEPILPRYIGQFEIKLNKVVVHENTNKGKKDEKGVSGS